MIVKRLPEEEQGLLLEMLSKELEDLLAELALGSKEAALAGMSLTASTISTPKAITPSPPLFDMGGFLLWTIAGLRLFHHQDLPSFETGTAQVRRVLVMVAQARTRGNITRMAALLGSSRRVIRQTLKDHGLYPPRADPDLSPRQLPPEADGHPGSPDPRPSSPRPGTT